MVSKKCVILVMLFQIIAASNLYADGAFVWRKGVDLYEPTQKAVIYWKDGQEILILQVKYEGPAEDFAWIVPVPSKPKVASIEPEQSPFAELSHYTQKRLRWGTRGETRGGLSEKEVIVLERKIVGVYDMAVLDASTADALSRWLNTNGYAFPEDRKEVLEHYTKKHWFYVAMRIERNALESDEVKKLNTGELQPIRLAFATNEMIYPLKISSVNTGETEVLLYILADTPMVVKFDYYRAGFFAGYNIGDHISQYLRTDYVDPDYDTYRKAEWQELPLTWAALELPEKTALFLCKYRVLYKAEQMNDDLVLERYEPLTYLKKFMGTPFQNQDEAIKEIHYSSVKRLPTSANLEFSRGYVYYLNAEYDKAITHYTNAIRGEPDYVETYRYRAFVYQTKGEYGQAIADYNDVIQKDPKDAWAYVGRGQIYHFIKNYDKAIADYTKAIELDPKYTWAYNNYAWLLATCPEANYRDGSKAVKLAYKALAIGYDPEFQDTLAAAYAEAGKFEDAIREQEELIGKIGKMPIRTSAKHLELFREHLNSYKARKPWREK